MTEVPATRSNRYTQIIKHVFRRLFEPGAEEVTFNRDDFEVAANSLRIRTPKNLGDVVYSFRYRVPLPESITSLAPAGREWAIFPAGKGVYTFRLVPFSLIMPRQGLDRIKVPDATPGVITRYATSDEQALLAKVRYNRLLDIFTGVACYSLQSHMRTTVRVANPLSEALGTTQVETDELYVGVDRHGAHHIFPIQAKGGSDAISVVQIWQDFRLAAQKFPDLIPRPVAAQFDADNVIVLFEFRETGDGIVIAQERHYQLTPEKELTDEDLRGYRDIANRLARASF